MYRYHLIGRLTWYRQLILLLIFICQGFSYVANAQTASFEIWPEMNVWYRFNEHWRASMFTPITKYNESKSRDWNVYLHLDYSFGKLHKSFFGRMADDNKVRKMKPWLVRGGYMKGQSFKPENGYYEDMAFIEIHRRVLLKHNFLFSHRLRYELRWLGESDAFSQRTRYRMMLEKNYSFKKAAIVPYVNLELYYDSRFRTVNRIRAIGGAALNVKDCWALEGNITYQLDAKYDTKNLFALNLILHLFFER